MDGTVRSDASRRSDGVRRSDGDRRGDWDHRGRDHDRDRFFFGFGVPFYGGYYGPSWGYGYSPWGYGGYYGGWGGYPIYDYGYSDDGYIGTYGGSSASYYTTEPRTQTIDTRQSGSSEGMTYFRRAQEAFRAGNYDEAVRWANHAAIERPRDGRLFLFVSQALFAIEQYGPAAGAVQQGLALSDPEEWGYVVKNFRSFYGNGNDYTTQLRALEKFVSEKPDAAYGRVLLGYHYGFLGYPDDARKQLDVAVKLDSRDELAVRLLERFGGETPRVARDGEERRGTSGETRDGAPRRDTRDERSQADAPAERPERTQEVAPPE